jgi:biotin carboxyl carrier protein
MRPQSGNDETDKAWEEIRRLIDELARMARSEISPPEFYTGMLDRIVAALAGIGGAVWIREADGPLSLQYQINLDQTRLASSDENRQRHRELLVWVLEKNEATFIPPHAGLTEGGPEVNPSDFLILLAPITVDDAVIGIVEVFKRPGGLPSARKGYLRFLTQMCGLAADFVKNHQLRTLKQRQQVWAEFEQFTRVAHASLNAREACFTLANEGRRFLDADRVSLAIKRGTGCRIESISGQDVLNRRSNTVRLLNRLTTRVVKTGEAFWMTDETVDVAPQIEYPLHEYIDESHTRALAIIPLRQPPKKPEKQWESSREAEPGKVIGALVVERFDNSRFDDGMRARIDSVAQHASLGLHNALQHSNIFLLPLWKFLGKITYLFRFRTLPKTLAVVALIAAATYLLGFVNIPFNLEGDGKLDPLLRREVYAPSDGDVIGIRAAHGRFFERGEELAGMRDRNLELEILKLTNEIGEQENRLATIEQERIRKSRSPDPQERAQARELEAEKRETEFRLESLRQQRQKLYEKQERLKVRAPIGGTVITWDVQDQLATRPVQRGQVLMSMADLDADWVLKVNMPEDRMGHVLAQRQIETEAAFEQLRQPELLGTMTPEEEQALQTVLDYYSPELLNAWDGWFLSAPPSEVLATDVSKLEPLLTKYMTLSSGERGRVVDAIRDGKLKVSFILATEPNVTHEGFVRRIAMSAESAEEKGTTVLLTVDFDRTKLPEKLRPGAEVIAKVHCGEAPIGYVYFHDVWSFIQKKILFRM